MTLRTEQWTSLDELRAQADAWDELWSVSEVALPTAGALSLAAWVEHFAACAALRIVVVRDRERLVAALPLVERRLRDVLRVGALPFDHWAPCGELLLASSSGTQRDSAEVLDLLAGELRRLPWSLLWLDGVRLQADRWQGLVSALERRGLWSQGRAHFSAGLVDTSSTWDDYTSRWTRNHRQAMRKSLRRVGQQRLELVAVPLEEPRRVLVDALQIEARSWKGNQGSAVLQVPGLVEFYARQCELLPEGARACLWQLELDGRPIAFDFGWLAKGVYFSYKVSYEPDVAHLSPGQLLRHLLLERLMSERVAQGVDFCGPLVQATAHWSDGATPVGRLTVVNRPGVAGLAYRTAAAWRALRWKESVRGSGPSEPADVPRVRAAGSAAAVPLAADET